MINYEYIDQLPAGSKLKLMLLERALVIHEELTNEQLQKILGVNNAHSIQDYVKILNEHCYCDLSDKQKLQCACTQLGKKGKNPCKNCSGAVNYISKAPKRRLRHRKYNLAFPEAIIGDDRKMLNEIFQLAAISDGAIPLKDVIGSAGLLDTEIQNVFSGISSVADIHLTVADVKIMSDLFKAIAQKKMISFRYHAFSGKYIMGNDERLKVFPFYLGRYNNKWFLAGKILSRPQNTKQVSYPWTMFPLKRILDEMNDNYDLITSTPDRVPADAENMTERIRSYYSNVMGFHVPTKEGAPFIETLSPLEIKIKIKPGASFNRTLRFILENPIHNTQCIEGDIVTLRVIENPALYAKLLSYGEEIEVLSPEAIRNGMAQKVQGLSVIYKNV